MVPIPKKYESMKYVIIGFCLSLIFIGSLGFLFRVPQTDFNAMAWKSFQGKCSHEKYGMAESLLKSGILIGLNINQVEELLGSDSVKFSSDQIEYCAGHDSKFNFNRPYHIVLQLESNASGVSNVKFAYMEGPL